MEALEQKAKEPYARKVTFARRVIELCKKSDK